MYIMVTEIKAGVLTGARWITTRWCGV